MGWRQLLAPGRMVRRLLAQAVVMGIREEGGASLWNWGKPVLWPWACSFDGENLAI